MRWNAVACRLFHRLRSKTDDENIFCAPAQTLLSNDRTWSSWLLHEFADRCCPRGRRCVSGRLEIADRRTNGSQAALETTIFSLRHAQRPLRRLPHCVLSLWLSSSCPRLPFSCRRSSGRPCPLSHPSFSPRIPSHVPYPCSVPFLSCKKQTDWEDRRSEVSGL